MEANEAIKIIEERFGPSESTEDYVAKHLAIEGIQRMTPMEPILIDGYPEIFYVCPRCRSTYVRHNYCANCGQKIRRE